MILYNSTPSMHIQVASAIAGCTSYHCLFTTESQLKFVYIRLSGLVQFSFAVYDQSRLFFLNQGLFMFFLLLFYSFHRSYTCFEKGSIYRHLSSEVTQWLKVLVALEKNWVRFSALVVVLKSFVILFPGDTAPSCLHGHQTCIWSRRTHRQNTHTLKMMK